MLILSHNWSWRATPLHRIVYITESIRKEIPNMKRAPVKRKKDKKIFHETASKTKSINVVAKPMRGGIRL